MATSEFDHQPTESAMPQPAAHEVPQLDPETEEAIKGILEDPEGYLARREAEEREDIESELEQRREVFRAKREAEFQAHRMDWRVRMARKVGALFGDGVTS